MIQPWKQCSSKTIHENPWWKYQLDEFELPNGVKGEYHYMETSGSVMILGIDKGGCVLLERHYVYLTKDPVFTFPCGGRKLDGSVLDEQREFGEETQQSAKCWQQIGSFRPCIGLIQEQCDVFVAWKLFPVQLIPDITEQFEIIALSPSEIEEKIYKKEIVDGMTLAAWTLAKPFVEKLIREKKYL